MANSDYRQELTERLIEQLEAGTAPWQKPWDGHSALPYNATTHKPYRGANSLYLSVVALARGYSDPRWATYKQAQAQGWQVRKGEKGVGIAYWKRSERDEDASAPNKKHDRPRVFYATVFNVAQMDGAPPLETKAHDWNPIEKAERILTRSGAVIVHDQADSAFYVPGADRIHLPPREQFAAAVGYYATALHELGHWTGHASRLGRDLSGPFGSESYAREELRAELASYFLSERTGVPHEPGTHASYVRSWIAALKSDKNEIFRAARDAEKITEYVLGFDRALTLEPIQKREFADPQRAAAQDAVIAAVERNPDHFLARYAELPQSYGGRYVSADLMKETFEVYAASPASRNAFNAPVHNAAAVLASEQYRRMLAEAPEDGRHHVVFITGTPGAGKTSIVLVAGELPPRAHGVYEGQVASAPVAIAKVRQALAAGFDVSLVAVHTTPERALDNTLARFDEHGRGAGIELIARLQAGTADGLAAVRKEFGDRVDLTIIDRRDANNPAHLQGWESLDVLRSEGNYEQIRQRLDEHLETRREAISRAAYAQARGEAPQVPPHRDRGGIDRIGEAPSNRAARVGEGQEARVLTRAERLARAFQSLSEEEARRRHPELAPVYDAWRMIEATLAEQFQGKTQAHRDALIASRNAVTRKLLESDNRMTSRHHASTERRASVRETVASSSPARREPTR